MEGGRNKTAPGFQAQILQLGPTEMSVSESLIGRSCFGLSPPQQFLVEMLVFSSIGPCWVVTKSLGSHSPWPAALLMRDERELPWCMQCGDLESVLGTMETG